jgi:hypothetical protein
LQKAAQFDVTFSATSLGNVFLRLRLKIFSSDWSVHRVHPVEIPCLTYTNQAPERGPFLQSSGF